MPFGLWAQIGQRNHVLDGSPDALMGRSNFEEDGAAYCKVYELSAVSCAKTAEPIKMPFGLRILVGPRSMCYTEVNIGATWRIRLNRPCAAAMRPFVKLL